MSTRYEHFNEITFEAYCKKCIDNAILSERLRKQRRAQHEQPLSALTDADLYDAAQEDVTKEILDGRHTVYFGDMELTVKDKALGQAISYLMPRDREIIMRYYFFGQSGPEIARTMGISVSAVQSRRKRALRRLWDMLRETDEADTVRRDRSGKGIRSRSD